MKIDSKVEPLVREALAAAVARDPGRSAAAAQALADAGDDAFRSGVALCFAVDSYALLELHDGTPTAERVASLASSFVEMESWAELDEATARTFLQALADERDPAAALPPSEAARAAFVVGAWLLAAFPPDERRWSDFLDQALDALEAAPQT